MIEKQVVSISIRKIRKTSLLKLHGGLAKVCRELRRRKTGLIFSSQAGHANLKTLTKAHRKKQNHLLITLFRERKKVSLLNHPKPSH